MDDPVTGDQQPGAAPRARSLIVDVALRVDRVVSEELHVRRLHDPVAYGDVPDLQRAEQVGIERHRRLLRPCKTGAATLRHFAKGRIPVLIPDGSTDLTR